MKNQQTIKPCVIFITGLSGSGKTTIANELLHQFNKAVLLDGDEIRKKTNLTAFDEASRKKHNLEAGKMAAALEKEGKTVIVALISPYDDVRKQIRMMCNNFIEVYLSTDIKVCMDRDPKGLYKKAMNGEIKDFTGISAPYYPPTNPEIELDTAIFSVEECTEKIICIASNRKVKNA